MHFSLRSLLHIFGGLLGLLSLLFVAQRLNAYAAQIDLSRFNINDWSLIGLLALLYGVTNILLALAWCQLLSFFEVKVQRKWAVKVYGLSQLAKYVPGNIFHLAGRQALGMAAGVSARALAKSALWELGLIAVAGTVLGCMALPLLWAKLPIFISIMMFSAISLAGVIALSRLLSPLVGIAFILQIIFLAVSGLVFIGILEIVDPSSVTCSDFSMLCGAYVIAWLGGLLTPGAPAGVGVRELILLFLLKGMVAEADLLLAVVLGRLVTVTGDLFYFGVSGFIKTASVGVNPKCD